VYFATLSIARIALELREVMRLSLKTPVQVSSDVMIVPDREVEDAD
jgi:hypothetical protein